eukprot:104925_1
MQRNFEEIFKHAYIEFIIDSSNHPQRPCTSFSSALYGKWIKYAHRHFTIIFKDKNKGNAYINNYKTEETMYQNYKRWYKNSKIKHQKKNAVNAFKHKANNAFSQWYVNKKNITDLNTQKYSNIGQWFTAIQNSNLSKHMRDKSHKNKGKHSHKKSNKSMVSTTSKKRKLYEIQHEDENIIEGTIQIKRSRVSNKENSHYLPQYIESSVPQYLKTKIPT